MGRTLLVGLAAAAAGKYFLDPAKGTQRRAMVKEKANEYLATLPSMDSLIGKSEGSPATAKSTLGALFASGAGSMLLSRMLGRRAGIFGIAPVAYALWKQARAAKASQSKTPEPIHETPMPQRSKLE
ncbi:MAG TPA: hypothetical protein VEK08_05170 [Planctomycetota bacterium]|nr:hypothetical protein [Planctomycetota bacterium]